MDPSSYADSPLNDQPKDNAMKRSRIAQRCALGAGLVLALSLAAIGCSEDPGTSGATTTSTTGATTSGSTSGSTSASTGGGGNGGGGGGSSSSTTGTPGDPTLSFFVSSTGSPTANLGGLAGADKRCQDLAAAVGAG